jgi:hypothetical protein
LQFDRLDTDLNLAIFDPSGQPVAYSASFDNNYELVEFNAEMSGTYKIGVIKARADEYSNYLGIAWVKDATYLPDLRNQGGWVTIFYVRNDGAAFQNVTIQYFDVNGNPTPWGSDVCALAPNQWCWIPVNDGPRIPAGTTGSAIVGSGEQVSLVAVHHHTSPEAWSAWTGINGPAIYAYSPLVYKNWYSINTQLYIQNTGSSSTNVTVEFKANSGSSCTQT